jgi:hypothetical protein
MGFEGEAGVPATDRDGRPQNKKIRLLERKT